MGETHSVQIHADDAVDPATQAPIGGPGNVPPDPNAPAPAEAQPDGARPDWLPEKFSTPNDLVEAYKSLEGRQRNPETTGGTSDLTIDKATPSDAPAVDAARYQQEVVRDGKLSEASVTELKALGFTDEILNAHVAGLSALRDQQVGKLNEIAGGAEQFDSIKTWARANLSEPEIEAFNATMNGGEVAQMELSMAGLRARYEGSSAGQADQIEGGSGFGEPGFASTAQMVQAMSDPRYSKDPAYRAEVMAKVKAGLGTVKMRTR